MKTTIDLPRVLDSSECELARLCDWILEPREPWTESQRFQLLVGLLEVSSERAGRVSASIADLLEERDSAALFVRTGIPSEPTWISEAIERLMKTFLPQPHPEEDLADSFRRVFRWRMSREWLEHVPFEALSRAVCLVGRDSPEAHRLRAAARKTLNDSILYLSAKLRSLGSEKDLRYSGYLTLDRLCQQIVSLERVSERDLVECRRQIERARIALRTRAVNLYRTKPRAQTVYQIERMSASLARLRLLLDCLPSTSGIKGARDTVRWVALFRSLLGGVVTDQSSLGILVTVLRVPFRAILEHSAKVGEKNIARLPREHRAIFISTLGGGVITCLMLGIKYAIPENQLSLFWQGFLASLNYSACFLLMQVFGFSLASKKPAMTGVTLSQRLGERPKREFLRNTWDAAKTQLYAAIGNVAGVGISALLAAAAYRACFGHDFISQAAAEEMVRELHPTRSGTLFFAALTGVLLWLASISSGCFARWSVHRKIKNGILKPRTMSGIGMNVGLGVLLGITPMIGSFFGLPLEVRHITLSAGALALAFGTLGSAKALAAGLWPALVGLLCIAVLNFGVSFYLAWSIDRRARRLEPQKIADEARERLEQALRPVPSLTTRRSV